MRAWGVGGAVSIDKSPASGFAGREKPLKTLGECKCAPFLGARSAVFIGFFASRRSRFGGFSSLPKKFFRQKPLKTLALLNVGRARG